MRCKLESLETGFKFRTIYFDIMIKHYLKLHIQLNLNFFLTQFLFLKLQDDSYISP